MKKSETEMNDIKPIGTTQNSLFDRPQRQSQIAIIFIVLRFLRRILRQLWPLAIALFLGRGGSSFDTFELAITGIGVFGIIPSVIAYYKFYFHLSDDELIINMGLFKKVKLNIPVERIQSVNFRQTFIHQFFNVTEVEIETAGSSNQETKIDAIDIPTAERLRARILERKALASSDDQPLVEIESQAEKDRETILQLTNKDLLKVGLVQNHFRPIGLLSGLIGSVYFYSYTFDFDPQDFFRKIYSYIEDFSIPMLSLIFVGLLAISVLYSMVSTLLRHYNLHFWRSGAKFQVVQGLFTRQEFAALDNKVQILNWGQNPIERLVGFYNIIFRQARSGKEKRRLTQFKIPGCDVNQVAYVREAWLGKDASQFNEYLPVSIHYFLHKAFYQIIFISIPIGVLFYLGMMDKALMVVILLILSISLNWVNYKKKRYAINDAELYIGSGTLGLRHALLPMYKVQNVHIAENPYQWRRGLATLIVHTAAGAVKIPYISKSKAIKLMDRLIYEVESSNRAWI